MPTCYLERSFILRILTLCEFERSWSGRQVSFHSTEVFHSSSRTLPLLPGLCLLLWEYLDTMQYNAAAEQSFAKLNQFCVHKFKETTADNACLPLLWESSEEYGSQ